ncbi:MAG: threonylcarbamoyl-AMP synthase [Deltaproteobacteria bacterium]|nr:threonylcarbamoyl-AMP synthase [Deltaproteobacteria bacterium]
MPVGKSRIIDIIGKTNFKKGIDEARGVLLSGGVVSFPTETFYGLAVNPMDEDAVDRLFRIKKRGPDRPILILLPSLESLDLYAAEIPDIAGDLIKRFWPGPLTILFRAMPCLSQRLTAGTGRIGMRLSSHPVATALAGSINSPVTGTSANISGSPACRTAMEVYEYFKEDILILNGGETRGGIGSTILDVTVKPPEIVREGAIGKEQLGLG